ncbi:Aste57867_18598 [Aphanomyces stellatus]|uniref:Aste57867_18598 protein n=1 Tax=Aphanomyces stellatus TaxID=120398 RepID=A0A485LAI7_9STRA|nr:hypothetical protein As57867_018536 [Aphanomyces stellatus]VFT95333.1 Aste57867_18598 [Aphanomyces stellatus]
MSRREGVASAVGRHGKESPPPARRLRSMLSLSDLEMEGDPLASLLKPCLFFYKFLQPIGTRKLELQMPNTVICEMGDGGGREDLLWLATDELGHVVHVDRPITWKRKYIADISGDDIDDDAIVAVRKTPLVKPHTPVRNQTVAVVARDLDRVLNGDAKRVSYVMQKYVRCRGDHVAIYRVVWTRGSANHVAHNILNNLSIRDHHGLDEDSGVLLESDPYDVALRRAAHVARYFCVSESDPGAALHATALRGQPIAPACDAIERIVAHAQLHLPRVCFDQIEADFIKDGHGAWWFLQVKSFSHHLRPPGIDLAQLDESDLLDSLVRIPRILRKRPDAACGGAVTSSYAVVTAATCFLCHAPYQLPPAELDALGLVLDEDDRRTVGTNFHGYVMTVKMVADAIVTLRQRGVRLASWEASLHRIAGMPQTLATHECRVCFVCYQVYKHQLHVTTTARAIHAFLAASSSSSADRVDAVVHEIDAFRRARDPLDYSVPPTWSTLTPVGACDVDPNCHQFAFLLLFHELQDILTLEDPTKYHLEYQLGQAITTLAFTGPKIHTIHRWQLCEARLHVALATPDALVEFIQTQKIELKLKAGLAFEGHASISLKPLLAHQMLGGDASVLVSQPLHVGVLVHVKTHHLGLIKLKLTLGLVASSDFADVRGAIDHVDFVHEHNIYWPQLSYFQPSVVVPIEWIALFATAENQTPREKPTSTNQQRRPSLGLVQMARTEVSLARDVHQQQRDQDKQAPFATVRRLAGRVGGPGMDTFPTFLLATLLRTISFAQLSPKAAPKWRAPATCPLATVASVDKLFLGLVKDKPLRLESVALLAELLFLLLANDRLPLHLPLDDGLEATLAPYWLQPSSDQVLVPLAHHAADQSLRVLWNRAVRRCHLAGFTSTPATSFLANHEWALERHVPDAQVLAHKRSLRTRLRILLYADIFECVETTDSGYMDMGEFRCLPQLTAQPPPLVDGIADGGDDDTITAMLSEWDASLRRQWAAAVDHTTHQLVASATFQAAFDDFDQFGAGGIGFREFWEMAESSWPTIEPPTEAAPGMCLRHGTTTAIFVNDAVCVHCDAEYLDALCLDRMPPPSLARAESVLSSVGSRRRIDASDDTSSSSSSSPNSNSNDDDDDDDGTRARRFSYFQNVQRSAVTKDFRDKVQSRIQRRYSSVSHLADDVAQNPKALASVLQRLATAERNTIARGKSKSTNQLAEIIDDNTAASPPPRDRRRMRLQPLANPPKKDTVSHDHQRTSVARLVGKPKQMKKAKSYAGLLEQELHQQSHPNDYLLARLSRMRQKRQQLDEQVVHELNAVRAKLAALGSDPHEDHRR